MTEEVILRFDDVTFEYQDDKPILDGVSFSVRRSAKITLMGQNGAGKSSLRGLIMGELNLNQVRYLLLTTLLLLLLVKLSRAKIFLYQLQNILPKLSKRRRQI